LQVFIDFGQLIVLLLYHCLQGLDLIAELGDLGLLRLGQELGFSGQLLL
jgi:hypothetical protein